ncbi:hypothetical protein GCM10010218_25450 [Streptomyces mashuensis]|uniref:Secreted protein n=1 Tax=Streptomyces mashuensis TaxID=33904 RepID=A0A919B1T1_9ACTN|nr:hypothetical protein GCM10010218_25450 [Streptomyces mashuensis]
MPVSCEWMYMSRRSWFSVAVVAATLAGGLTVAPAANAAGSPPVECWDWWHNAHKWTAKCEVKRGAARALTDCGDMNNPSTRYGRWVGVGRWDFGGDCGDEHFTASDIQSTEE